MALEYWWILIICVFIAGIVGVIGLISGFAKKDTKQKKVYFANTSRLTESPEYKSLYAKYKKGIIGILAFSLIALLAFGITASKPVSTTKESTLKYNRDVVLCLDVSGSMVTVDSEVVKKFKTLSEGFKGERISLVIFNSTSNQVFPLTDDYGYIQEQLDNVQVGLDAQLQGLLPEDGYNIFGYTVNGEGASLIGDGLTACTLNFDDPTENQENRSKSIILATDNATNGTELVTLTDAAAYAKENKVKVYSINPEATSTPEQAEALKVATESTGGTYYDLNDPSAVSGIIDQISSEETSAMAGQEQVVEKDAPQPYLIIGALALLGMLGLAWRFRV